MSATGSGNNAMVPTLSERGFKQWPHIVDDRGVTIRVAESSASGGPYLWVFTTGGEESYKKPQDGSAHLTIEQAVQLRDSLASAIAALTHQTGDSTR